MDIQSGDKLYIIVRSDISAGYQCAQSAHALMQFNIDHSEIAKLWYNNSNYICILSIKNEEDLYSLICEAKNLDIKLSIFREPDINNEITAIALSPCSHSKELCKNLKLALKDI